MSTPYGRDEHGNTGEYRETPVSLHYRYGYRVADAEPRLIGNSDDRGYAVREAKKAADSVRFDLQALGAPSIVSVWVQQRKRTITVEFSEPETVEP